MRVSQIILVAVLCMMPLGFWGCQPQQQQAGPAVPNGTSELDQSDLSGADVYERNCSMCHGMSGGGSPMVPTNVRFTDPAWQKSMSDAQIASTIQNGAGSMPAFGEKLTPEEIKRVVAHIRSLPNPPKTP